MSPIKMACQGMCMLTIFIFTGKTTKDFVTMYKLPYTIAIRSLVYICIQLKHNFFRLFQFFLSLPYVSHPFPFVPCSARFYTCSM